jgi:hypothetical protein
MIGLRGSGAMGAMGRWIDGYVKGDGDWRMRLGGLFQAVPTMCWCHTESRAIELIVKYSYMKLSGYRLSILSKCVLFMKLLAIAFLVESK